MTEDDKKYINENRLNLSMIDMSEVVNISYNKVRDYMIKNNLTLSKKEINVIKCLKRKSNNLKTKKWNWDALP